MPGELGESQLSSLLESVPGLASVLRSPVADAIVNMTRAAAGLREFDLEEAKELVQYATRRGLISQKEGSNLLEDVTGRALAKGSKKASRTSRPAVKKAAVPEQAKSAKPKAKAVPKVPAKKKVPKKKAAPKQSKGRPKAAKVAKKKRR